MNCTTRHEGDHSLTGGPVREPDWIKGDNWSNNLSYTREFYNLSCFLFSFGRRYLMNTESTPLENTMAIATCSWNELTFTTTKHPVENTYRVQSLSTWSRGPWTQCALAHTANCSDQTISFFVRQFVVLRECLYILCFSRPKWCWGELGQRSLY